ncbi:MAG: hypothetical protein GY719_26555 [bacterium]|nr:hypothetical protein [bacterium]
MRTHLTLLLAVVLALPASAAPSPKAVELRNRGLAELENEKPELAEQAYRQLVEVAPKEPLGFGNLAIAELRQQKYEAAMASIDSALELAPGRADLLAIKSEVLQWTGDLDGALALMREAAAAAPDDIEILYAAYQLATTVRTEDSEAAAGKVLQRLARLRPENLVVLLQLGQRAVANGDRAVASAVFLRVEQLLWQVEEIATRALGMVTEALEGDDLSRARVPAVRLENVLKVSPMYRESLRELKTGIQGVPIKRFVDEPEIGGFGDPLEIELAGTRLDERPTAGRALAAGDFDGDGKPDLARIRSDEGGGVLEVRLAVAGWKAVIEYAAAGLDVLLAADIDNDGHLDLVAFGASRGAAWLGAGDGGFGEAPEALGLGEAGAAAAAVVDFDIEGDLDLVLTGGASGPADLYRNTLEGPLERVGMRSLPRLPVDDGRAVVASDLDRDGDLDLVFAGARGLRWVDNLRQGRFVDRSTRAGLRPSGALQAAVSADLDNDGFPDLVGGGSGLAAWHNREGRLETWELSGLPGDFAVSSLHAFDADNDGRLDLAAVGAGGVLVLAQKPDPSGPRFEAAAVSQGPGSVAAVISADLDQDGDLDLVVAGPEGLHWLENRGGNRNRWLAVRLRGLAKGNSKNNFHGVGSSLEVFAGKAYQFRETAGDVVHLGIGSRDAADVLRVVWTNGVPQNRLRVAGNQSLVEEQLLKGSCPFLYAWNGHEHAFVTDLLWGAPLGLPVAPGAWASSDAEEIVHFDAAPAADGSYQLRITEELWEAAFFDYVRLWVVDHPAELEVASNLRIVPGETLPERVLASRDLRPVARAWDGQGRDVTRVVRQRDEVYADGYVPSRYQGVSREWTFTFDLGEAPAAPVRLHLDGWIFPADASLNLAVAQRRDLPYLAPRLEVETVDGWRELMPNMGHPAGKTKTMVVDTPPLPAGASKLRIVTSLWLHWDRVAWTTQAADEAPIVRARLAPHDAELRYRGFSALVRQAPNAPHTFDYADVRTDSPWLPFPGSYTRYGDVRELLAASDDFTVILAPGDEIALSFDASGLVPPPPGFRRTLFLESHGWDKDADRNTFEGERLEPLPFRAMTGYPWAEDEFYPDTPAHRAYRRDWLTRRLR